MDGRRTSPEPMAETPSRKVVVVSADGTPSDDVASFLASRFKVVRASSKDAAAHIADPEVALVLVDRSEVGQLGASQALGVLDSIGAGVALLGGDGSVIWESAPLRELPDETRRLLTGVFARATVLTAVPQTIEAPGSEGPRVLEVVATRASGAQAQGHASGSLVTVVVRDVTDARRMEEKLEAIDSAGRALLGFDPDSIRKLNAAERLGFLQDQVSDAARRLMRFDHFTVRLLDRETRELPVVMAVGVPANARGPELRASRTGNGIIGHVAETGRTYVCPDTSAEPLYRQGLASARSCLTIPLMLNDRVIGVFNVESTEPNAFGDQERRMGEIFARSVALTLHVLDLLVVERSATNEAASGRFEGEVREPLEDLAVEAEWLRSQGPADQEWARHIERILKDVDSIKKRIRDVARGPRTILGAERAIREGGADPLLENRRVLVADDEPAIRETIRDVLSRRGCSVFVHSDGASAVLALEEAMRAKAVSPGAPGFDLVISDIKMPDRNGYEVFSAAKQLDPTLPVILMTGFGYDPHHSIVRASQEGLQCVLFKPFQVERLLDEVKKAITTRG